MEGIKIEHNANQIVITIDKNVVDLEYIQGFLEILRLKYLVQKMDFQPHYAGEEEEEPEI